VLSLGIGVRRELRVVGDPLWGAPIESAGESTREGGATPSGGIRVDRISLLDISGMSRWE